MTRDELIEILKRSISVDEVIAAIDEYTRDQFWCGEGCIGCPCCDLSRPDRVDTNPDTK